MPDKPLTVITYAASASLAAIALVYFFNPNFLLDGESSTGTASARKKSVVGLSNPANDCFINSVLQSLAGLGDVRLYLIRELHRRKLDGAEVYNSVPEKGRNGKPVNSKKLLSLQGGEVTQGLKDMIDSLNERPIYKKTISAANFIAVLEHAFGTRISKSQQDAQELLQIVAERLCDEYHAGEEARKRAKARSDAVAEVTLAGLGLSSNDNPSSLGIGVPSDAPSPTDERISHEKRDSLEEEDGFPLEGRTESQIECQYCHFIPKPNPMTFVMLTLAVPQKSSTTLNECFDAHFKTEYIDDYKCDKCRLEHALETFRKSLARANSQDHKRSLQRKIELVEKAIEEDPEKPPEGVELPDSKQAPTRRIARHVQITAFPKILVIHLSRSIYDPRSSSTKNAAKVSFPESLPLGGLLNRRNYKLLGMVSHKGTHNNGHYESFRRQHTYAPFSTPHIRHASSPYNTSPNQGQSAIHSPTIHAGSIPRSEPQGTPPPTLEAAELLPTSTISPSSSSTSALFSSPSSRPSSGSGSGSISTLRDSMQSSKNLREIIGKKSKPEDSLSAVGTSVTDTNAKAEDSHSTTGSFPGHRSSVTLNTSGLKRKKKLNERWWRISDDKIKECKTSDALGMQKEVYMLFYEMEKE